METYKEIQEKRQHIQNVKSAMSEEQLHQKEDLKIKLKQKQAECNEEANRAWRNDRIYEVTVIALDDETVYLDLAVGKFEARYYTLKLRIDGYDIIDSSASPTSTMEDIVNYFILPICFPVKQ